MGAVDPLTSGQRRRILPAVGPFGLAVTKPHVRLGQELLLPQDVELVVHWLAYTHRQVHVLRSVGGETSDPLAIHDDRNGMRVDRVLRLALKLGSSLVIAALTKALPG